MDLVFSPHQDLQLDEYDSGRDAMTYHRTWMSMVGHWIHVLNNMCETSFIPSSVCCNPFHQATWNINCETQAKSARHAGQAMQSNCIQPRLSKNNVDFWDLIIYLVCPNALSSCIWAVNMNRCNTKPAFLRWYFISERTDYNADPILNLLGCFFSISQIVKAWDCRWGILYEVPTEIGLWVHCTSQKSSQFTMLIVSM